MTVFKTGREKWRVADAIRAHGWAVSSVVGVSRTEAVGEIQELLWDLPISYVWSGNDTFVDQRRWSWLEEDWRGFGDKLGNNSSYTPELHGVPGGDPSLMPPATSRED